MKKLIVTGGGGQVATEYMMSHPLEDWEFLFLNKKEFDITNPKKDTNIFKTHKPDAVLNLAAYTNVEKE